MYLLEIDSSRNLLHLTLMGIIEAAQAEAILSKIERRREDLQKGFIILTDLTGLKTLEPSTAPYIQKTMDLCNECGVSKVIRIIPEPAQNFGLTVMSYFHYDQGVPVVTCSNLEEAAKRFLQK